MGNSRVNAKLNIATIKLFTIIPKRRMNNVQQAKERSKKYQTNTKNSPPYPVLSKHGKES